MRPRNDTDLLASSRGDVIAEGKVYAQRRTSSQRIRRLLGQVEPARGQQGKGQKGSGLGSGLNLQRNQV
jgi:hypothetical protein